MNNVPPITFISDFPDDQYVKEDHTKFQIYMHHTAGNADPYAVIDYWKQVPERVGTAFIIGGKATTKSKWKDGEVLQIFNSRHSAWHLGLKSSQLPKNSKTTTWLNLNTIGIELCNWGGLIEKGTKFVAWSGAIVKDDDILEIPTTYRGYRYWQRYTNAQLENARKLLISLCDRWSIDKTFKGPEIFNIDSRAFSGESGIFTHTSVRRDKVDCFPQKELIQMLKSL